VHTHGQMLIAGALLSICVVAVARMPVAEGLVVTYPADFDILLNKDGYEPKDWPGFVPKGETEENWTLKLGQRTDAKGAKQDPERYFDEFARGVSEKCEGTEIARGKAKEKAGSHTAYVSFIYCNKDKSSGNGEVAAYRLISGEEAMYIVKMAKRVPPFTADSMPSDINLVYMQSLVRQSSVCRGTKC